MEQAPETNVPPTPSNALIVHLSSRDRDYHLKTYKSVVPGSKLVDWLLAQVSMRGPDCSWGQQCSWGQTRLFSALCVYSVTTQGAPGRKGNVQ